MDILERLELLKSCELIDQKGYDDLLQIIAIFKDFGVVLTEENAGVMVTHIAAAFKRLTTKEPVNPLDKMVLEQLEQEPVFEAAKAVVETIRQTIKQELSADEYDFILVHAANVMEGLK